MYKNQWFYIYFQFYNSILSPTNLVYGFISSYYILDTFYFSVGRLPPLPIFQIFMVFFSPNPSFKVLWFFWLYLLLLSCSTFEILWFLNLHFLLLSCSTRPCFLSLHLGRYLYTWTATDEIWKILLITFQLVPHNSFIKFMLSCILFQLLCKIFLCNLPPFLKLCLRILHLVLRPHQGGVFQHLFIMFQFFLDTSWIQKISLFLCHFELCLEVLQIFLILLPFFQ